MGCSQRLFVSQVPWTFCSFLVFSSFLCAKLDRTLNLLCFCSGFTKTWINIERLGIYQ